MSDGNDFYVVKTSARRNADFILLEKYSTGNVSVEKSITIPFPVRNEKKFKFEDIFVVGGNAWVFFSCKDELKKEQVLYAQRITAMTPDSALIEVDRASYTNNRQIRGFQFVESKTTNELLIVHHFPFEKYNNEKFSWKLYDGQMKLHWAKDIELPYKDQVFTVTGYLIDSSLNVHIVSSFRPERKKGDPAGVGIPNNKYVMISYYPAENKLKEFEISLSEKWISALTFDLAPDDDIVIAGFYSNSQLYSIAGTFYLRIESSTRKTLTSNLKAFEKDFLMEFIPEKKLKKGKELSDFYFDHFIIREDGSAMLVAEQYYMVVIYNYNDPYGYSPYGISPYSYSRSSYNYQYYYNDLIVVSINKAGEIEWSKKIPKRQMSTNDGGYYSSYALAHTNDKTYILFNDNPKNTPEHRKNDPDIYTMIKPSKSTVTLVEVDRSGNIAYKPLFNQRDEGLILRPKFHYQYAWDKLILYCQRGNKYKFGLVKF